MTGREGVGEGAKVSVNRKEREREKNEERMKREMQEGEGREVARKFLREHKREKGETVRAEEKWELIKLI